MRILVTGGDGQLGRALGRETGPHEIIAVPRAELDLTSAGSIVSALARHRPDMVINAAAYTAVDAAERDEDAAFAVNAAGPGMLAAACARSGLGLIHVSTDYVFDGTLDRAYREDDRTNPLNAYGRTKLAGEQAVLAAHPAALVVRTSWVYAEEGRNFLRTMIALAATRGELTVVADQVGAPTYARDLARGLLAMVVSPAAGQGDRVFHLTASGETSWYGFANEIFRNIGSAGRKVPRVMPVKAADWPSPTVRPLNSRLDCSRFTETYKFRMPAWGDGLANCLDTMSGAFPPDTEAK